MRALAGGDHRTVRSPWRRGSPVRYKLAGDTWYGLTPVADRCAAGGGRLTTYIVGSGHSGSTLLDMLLAGHPSVSSLGEPIFLYLNANSYTASDVCTCGQHVSRCPFWAAVDRAGQEMLGLGGEQPVLPRLAVADPRMGLLRDDSGQFPPLPPGVKYPFRSLLHESVMVLGSQRVRRVAAAGSAEVELHRRVSANLNFLYDAVRLAHKTPVIVDSTKNPGYMKGVYLERTAPMRFLLVLRDGRGICQSRLRREGVDMPTAARLWVGEHVKRMAAQATIPRRLRTVVRYETLCANPERELRRICTLLGLEFEPEMLQFRRDRHNLGGNPMRLRTHEAEIELDDSWRSTLTARELAQFNRIGGRLNRWLGYDD